MHKNKANGVILTMVVNVIGGELPQEEINIYKAMLTEKYHNRVIEQLDITVDGDSVDVKTTFAKQPFFRLRRISGYLVNSLERWNNAKKAEERDRVKHTV